MIACSPTLCWPGVASTSAQCSVCFCPPVCGVYVDTVDKQVTVLVQSREAEACSACSVHLCCQPSSTAQLSSSIAMYIAAAVQSVGHGN